MEITFMHLGEFALAMEHFEKALSLYDPERHRDDAFLYAQNPGVAMRCYAAWALWFLGQPDQALDRMQRSPDPGARVIRTSRSGPRPLLCGDSSSASPGRSGWRRNTPRPPSPFRSEHGLVMYQAMATIMRGWALLEQGRTEEAIEQMRQGLAALQATGTERVRPHFLALLAEAMDTDRRVEEGLRLLEEAQALIDRNSERYYQAELYRLQGELLLKQSKGRGIPQMLTSGKAVVEAESTAVTNAEGCFNQSIKIAQRQKAKSLELRAVMSLARLIQKQGRKEEARRMLKETYGWFTEGFDTADLIEARALLDDFSGSSRKSVQRRKKDRNWLNK